MTVAGNNDVINRMLVDEWAKAGDEAIKAMKDAEVIMRHMKVR